jgi:hypothetical protein
MAAPGQLDTLGLNPTYGPAAGNMEANIQKLFKVTESKSLSFRVDSSDVFHLPNPSIQVST